MNNLEKLNCDVQKYLRLRKIFRAVETSVSLIAIIILLNFDTDYRNIFVCVATILIVPESFLSVKRNEIKTSIKDEKLKANTELDLFSKMKSEFKNMKNDFITQGSKKSVSDECKQLVWKEEMGICWLSTKINEFEKECDKAQQVLENLKSIEERLVIF